MRDLSFEQTWISFTNWSFVPGLVEIGPVVLEMRTYKFRYCIFVISNSLLSPLRKKWGPSLGNTWIPSNQGCFELKVKSFSGSWGKEFYIFRIFPAFLLLSFLKRALSFIWTNLNSLYSRMFCAKFGWNWSSYSGEEDEYVKSWPTDVRRHRPRITCDQKSYL